MNLIQLSGNILLSLWKPRARILDQNNKAVADPGFPVGGGGANPLGGRQPLTCTLFGENVCKNKRN